MKTMPLKTRQVCLFFIAFTTVTKIFTLPSLMASKAQEDLWLSTLFSLALDLITITALTWVCKKQNLTFIGLLEKNLGKPLTKIIIFLYALYFLLKAYIPINEQKSFVELALYINNTTDLYFLPFFVVAFYLATKNLRTIARVSDVIWVISVIGLIILISLSVKSTDISAILPIGARGVKSILRGSYAGANWYGESAYFLFFVGQFAYEKRSGLKIILSYLVGAVLVIAFMIIFYGIFTSIAFRQSFALTEIAKYTTVINNIGRFDYIGIVMLLFSSLFALSLPIFFCCHCLEYLFPLKKRWIMPLVVTCVLLLTTVYLNEFYFTLQKISGVYLGAFFLFMANLLPLICLIFTIRERNNENFIKQPSA